MAIQYLHAQAITIASSLLDIFGRLAIAFRRSCRVGLLTGVAVSLFYMIGAAIITPELWIEPLGALVKTGPAIVLMLVAFAMLGGALTMQAHGRNLGADRRAGARAL